MEKQEIDILISEIDSQIDAMALKKIYKRDVGLFFKTLKINK